MHRQASASEAALRESEERYRSIFESSGDAIVATDASGRFTEANPAALRLLGYTRQELLELTYRDVTPVRWHAVEEAVVREQMPTRGYSDEYEKEYVRKDGTIVPVSIRAFIRRDSAGFPAGAWGIVRDTTERKRAEEALRESEEKLALAIEAADMGTWHGVPWGTMECSPRLRAIFGMGEREVLEGMEAFLRFVHPEDREAHRAAVLESLDPRGDGRYRDEYRCVRPDGTVRWISARGIVRFAEVNGARQAVRGAGTVLDVTERRLAEEKLAAEKRQLDETLRSLKSMQAQLMQADRMASVGMLAAGVAHEINNPLAYVIAALDFLDGELKELEPALPAGRFDEMIQSLADAREGSVRVKHVVHDLKTFSRRDEEQRYGIDVRPILESSIHMAFNEIKYRARLVKGFGVTPLVFANQARLGQVFLNLLVNAAQAIPEGFVEENEIRVVTVTDGQGRAVVEVRDTGSGISQDVLGRIFDPFFTTKPMGVGTGLGLSICHNIVTSFGGEISVVTRVGEGTTFRVTLPPAHANAAGEAGREPVPVTQSRRGRVLVVDDEPAICAAVRRLLAPEHDVAVAPSAREALDRVMAGERFDVILCDVMMPDLTGMELHDRLATIAPGQAERMVLLTGGAFTQSASESLSRVPDVPVVEKPFDPESLRSLVRRRVLCAPRPP